MLGSNVRCSWTCLVFGRGSAEWKLTSLSRFLYPSYWETLMSLWAVGWTWRKWAWKSCGTNMASLLLMLLLLFPCRYSFTNTAVMYLGGHKAQYTLLTLKFGVFFKLCYYGNGCCHYLETNSCHFSPLLLTWLLSWRKVISVVYIITMTSQWCVNATV